jgi:hypothetical protein
MRNRLQLAWIVAINGAFAYFIAEPLRFLFRVLRAMECSFLASVAAVLQQHPIISAEIAVLLAGIGLEAVRSRYARLVNVGFFAVQFVIFIPAMLALGRGIVANEIVPFVVIFGMTSLPIAVTNYFLYRSNPARGPGLQNS